MPRFARFSIPLLPFLSLLAVTGSAAAGRAASCPVAKAHAPSNAEKAFLEGHFDQAADLYQAQLQKTPDDVAAVAGLAQALLRQQKIAEADAAIRAALEKNKSSAVLLTALGEVQYREGTPWLAVESLNAAIAIDVCLARERLLSARLNALSSDFGKAAKDLAIAHSLDPHDPDIRLRWLNTLPQVQRISELEAYLASDTGDDPDDLHHLRVYLESLKKRQAEPHKPCRLVSDASTTEIPFAQIMRDATHVRAFGLDVKLNDHRSRLEIDTGASGLVISRSVAEHAHVVRYTEDVAGGIGSGGERSSYRAYAESIQIGALEFHDCEVSVVDKLGALDIDGLIGMNVFSRFLVTLDFPMRKLALGQLPKRPNDIVVTKPELNTAPSSSTSDDSADKTAAKDAAPAAAPNPLRGPQDRYIAPEMANWTRVYREGHQLMVPTRLNDSQPRLFILDTGAFETTVSPKVARQVTKVGDSDRRVRGISGEVDKVYSAEEIEFRFANIRQKVRGVVAFETPMVSQHVGLEIAGFIGATTLGQVTMSIDYRDALVKFDYDANRGQKYPGLR